MKKRTRKKLLKRAKILVEALIAIAGLLASLQQIAQ